MSRRRTPTIALSILLGWVLATSVGAATLPPWLAYEASPSQEHLALVEGSALDEEREREFQQESHPYVDLLERHELAIGASKRLVQRSIRVRRILRPEAVQDWGNETVYARPGIETLSIDAAFVVHPTGSHEAVDAKTLQVVDAAIDGIFSEVQAITIPFPGVQSGSTLVTVVTRVFDANHWPLPWSQTFAVRGMGPIGRFDVVAEWDEGAKVPQWSTNDPEVECAKPSDRRVVCTRSDIEPFRFDPEVSSWGDLQTWVVFSEVHEWSDLVDRELALVEERMDIHSTEALLSGTEPPNERLVKIYRFVADDIRYVAFEHGVRAVVPRHASETLGLRYGDCKDKVTLFLALARAAGLEAYPALVASARYDVERVAAPSWRWFDHMVACVVNVGPEPVCLELTTRDADAGVLPTNLHGALALPLVKGTTDPTRLPAPNRGWAAEARVRNRVECDGSISEEVTLRFRGAAALGFRSEIRPMNRADRVRRLETMYRSAMGETPVPTFEISGLEAPGDDVVVSSRNQFEGNGSAAPWTQVSEPDYWLVYLASGLELENRHNPGRTVGIDIRSDVEYEFCESKRVRHVGANLQLESEFGAVRRHYEMSGPKTVVRTTFDLLRNTVLPTEIPRFNRFLDLALRQTPIWVGLEDAP